MPTGEGVESPARRDGKGGAKGPKLDVRLITCRLDFRDPGEFARAARHRYMLAQYLSFACLFIVTLYLFDFAMVPLDPQVPSVVVGLLAGLGALVLYVTLMVRLQGRNREVIQLWLSPGLAIAAGVLVVVVHAVHRIMEVDVDWTALRSRMIPGLAILYFELAATISFRGAFRRALVEIRRLEAGGEPVLPAIATATDRPATEAADGPAAAQPAAAGGGGAMRGALAPGIAIADVLRLEANGNYVVARLPKGPKLLPGPFAAVVARMPATQGLRVHRSHWVAKAAIQTVRREGRDLLVILRSGDAVPVSAAYQGAVRDWQRRQEADPEAASGRAARVGERA